MAANNEVIKADMGHVVMNTETQRLQEKGVDTFHRQVWKALEWQQLIRENYKYLPWSKQLVSQNGRCISQPIGSSVVTTVFNTKMRVMMWEIHDMYPTVLPLCPFTFTPLRMKKILH